MADRPGLVPSLGSFGWCTPHVCLEASARRARSGRATRGGPGAHGSSLVDDRGHGSGSWYIVQMATSIRESLSTRDNALNLVRLLLAVAVIIGHAWILGGFGEGPFPGLAGWAVNAFFAISGYLITGSRLRSGILKFLMNRVLRIFPAFWVVLVVTASVIAPLVSVVAGESWLFGSATSYVVLNAGLYIFQWGIVDTLSTVPHPGAWNGSLWTLFYEFSAYLCAGALLSGS